ncbi:MAG: HTTM domain-containing protein, partial [Cytophagales bacterium]|nr:HTTM domain-containing protein [Cytophagales bacterium]
MLLTYSHKFKNYIQEEVHIAPLVVFRVLFGLVMLASAIRFYLKGWIETLYIQPSFHFNYYGFEWVEALGSTGMYLLFGTFALSSLCMALGFLYRISSLLFFTSFTYIELIDKTTYLNHYYFISLVALLLIFVPAHQYFSIDTLLFPSIKNTHVPRWTISIFKLQLAIVYVYAGIAKIHKEWLFDAMPLKIWLPAHSNLPLIGWLFRISWIPYVFAWIGMIYDLVIPFALRFNKTRLLAYLAVVVFHMLNTIMFNIGMFSYIMILATLIFFPSRFHINIINWFQKVFNQQKNILNEIKTQYTPKFHNLLLVILGVFFIVQLTLPFRYLLYPNPSQLFWTEEGFRFSWRVMLIEKMGYLVIKVTNADTGHTFEIDNREYLTTFQEKMTSTQPDMVLQYAHILAEEMKKQGIKNPIIKAQCYVTLN